MESQPSFQKKKRVNEFEQNNKILKMFPITENNQVIDFCTVDIEAQDWVNYVVGGIYDGEKFYHTPDLTKLIDDCFVVGLDKGIKTFWAHFGGKYDFNFFLKVTLTNKKFIVEEIIPRGSGILSFKVRYNVEVVNCSDAMLKHEVIFRDSSALLPFSLKMLTKSFKVDTLKGYIDYQFIRHAWENMDYTSILLGKELDERIKKYEKLLRDNEPVCYKFFYNGNEVNYYDFKNIKDYDPRKTEYQYLQDTDPEYKHKIYGREDLLNYLEDDLKGLYQVLKKFYDWPLIKKSGPAFTMAGQAVKVLRTYLKKPLYSIPKNSENIEEFVRQSYFGGRTEVFRPVFQSRNENDYLYCFDVNSLYPTVMQRNMYPNLFKKWGYSRKEFDTEEFGFWECEVEVPKDMYAPPLGTYHSFEGGSKKFIFPTGRFLGVWSSLELKYAESIGVKILDIRRGAIFHNGHHIFKDFIDDLYAKRLLAKKEKDSVSDLMTKLLMNSCYGRFGMNLEKENLVVDTGFDNNLTPHCEIPLDNGETITLSNKKIIMESTFTNVAIASWVTSHARVMMHKEFMKLGDNHLFYTDTDSIFTDKMLPSGDALGEMKLEYKAKSAVFLLPKTYIIDEIEGEKYTRKLTMKGFDKKKIQHFTPTDFLAYLEGEVRYLSGEIDKIETNIKVDQSPRFATFKTALQKGMFVCMNNDPETDKIADIKREEAYLKKTGKFKRFVKKEYKMSERSLKAVYDKRILTDNGFDSKPFHLGG